MTSRWISLVPSPTIWHGCDHLGPVHEGDTLRSTISVEQVEELSGGAGLVHLRSLVRADGSEGSPPRDVLDWRYITVVA
jgi:acyl dehydratase